MHNTENGSKRTIAILGGGPAGSATALSLLQALKASNSPLADSTNIHLYHSPRKESLRVGETIPPAATTVLRRLGVSDIIENNSAHIECPGSISVWGSEQPGHNDFFFDLAGHGYHLNRTTFDSQLLDKAKQAGVIFHQGERLSGVRKHRGKRLLNFSNDRNESHQLEADFVVDATGRGAAFLRRLKVYRNTFDEVIFLCAFIDVPKDSDISAHTFVESVPQGWWYAARLPGDKMIITFCCDKQSMESEGCDNPTQWLSLLKQTKWVSKNIPYSLFHAPASTLEVITQHAPSSLMSAVSGQDWIAVGDAAGSCDPITSAGITKALMQGEQAGIAIAKHLSQQNSNALQCYQQQVVADFKQYVSVRGTLYGSEPRFADSPFWSRRQGRG